MSPAVSSRQDSLPFLPPARGSTAGRTTQASVYGPQPTPRHPTLTSRDSIPEDEKQHITFESVSSRVKSKSHKT